MKFKVGDKVKFTTDEGWAYQKGIGVIVDIVLGDLDDKPYLIHSEDIVRGHNGASFDNEGEQDNNDNWWFKESELKLVESCDDTDEVDMVNEPLHYNLGEIQTLDYIDDVLLHNPNLTALDGYYLGNIIKYLSTRLGTKADKIEDMQKAQFYLNRRVKIEEESE